MNEDDMSAPPTAVKTGIPVKKMDCRPAVAWIGKNSSCFGLLAYVAFPAKPAWINRGTPFMAVKSMPRSDVD